MVTRDLTQTNCLIKVTVSFLDRPPASLAVVFFSVRGASWKVAVANFPSFPPSWNEQSGASGELGQTIRCLVNGKVIHASVILVDVGNGDVCYRGIFVATLF